LYRILIVFSNNSVKIIHSVTLKINKFNLFSN